VTRVLVVEDETAISDAVEYALRNEGFDVETRPDGETGLEAALEDDFAVVILDLMLPGIPGTEVCRRLRAQKPTPIIMLTARNAEVDRVVGLEIGADDYVAKPFSMAELIGRIRALLRRQQLDRNQDGAPVRRIGDLEPSAAWPGHAEPVTGDVRAQLEAAAA